MCLLVGKKSGFGLIQPGASQAPGEGPKQTQARPLLSKCRSLHRILPMSTFFTNSA